MVDGSASLLTMTHAFLNIGFWKEDARSEHPRHRGPFYEVYETADERFVAVGAIEAKFFAALLEGLGLGGRRLPGADGPRAVAEVKEPFARSFDQDARRVGQRSSTFWTPA